MLTNKDIERLMAVFPTKEDVRSIVERELEPVRKTQQEILTAMDRLATAIEKQNLQFAAMTMQLNRHEKWIRQMAKQAGVTLED